MVGNPEERVLRLVPPGNREAALLLDCTFRDVAGSRVYPVAPDDWERIMSAFESPDKAFLGLTTTDGRTVFLNLGQLQTCRIGSVDLLPARPGWDSLVCKMVGTEAIRLSDVDREWVPNIRLSLEEHDRLNERFVQFPDELGGWWAIRIADIVFLEYPSDWQDEAGEGADALEGIDGD